MRASITSQRHVRRLSDAVKRFLPKSLLGRSLLIIVTPLIVLQVVSAYIFYDRHWETVTRRLTLAIANEISMVIDHMRRFPGPENEDWIFQTAIDLNLYVTFSRGAILPRDAPDSGWGISDRRLRQALEERVRRPFQIDSDSNDDGVEIRIQLPDGVVEVLVPRKRLFSSTTYIFVLWMVGTSLVLFAVAMVFMRNQVRPIRRLAIAVDNFGKGRDVPDIKPEGSTEIRVAAGAFNVMRERVQSAIVQRTEMLAGVSHDLRTPLTRMKLQLAMLGTGEGVADLKADVVEMENMVNEYLAFVRGEGTEAVTEIDIGDTLGEIVAGASRDGARIELVTDSGILAPVKPNAFRRCMTNLVANAVRYASRVVVTAHRQGESIEISVDDDGPGIPAGERESVFKPFYRLDASRNPETGGTGLGLTIARDIIRGHGGEISLDESPLGGLRARVMLPL